MSMTGKLLSRAHRSILFGILLVLLLVLVLEFSSTKQNKNDCEYEQEYEYDFEYEYDSETPRNEKTSRLKTRREVSYVCKGWRAESSDVTSR
jgi:hypothetical protein